MPDAAPVMIATLLAKSAMSHLLRVQRIADARDTVSLDDRLIIQIPIAELVAGRAHFADAPAIVSGLTDRGLIEDDALTPTGGALLGGLRARVATLTAPVWADLDPGDVAAAERVLTRVGERAQEVLWSLSSH